MALTTLNIRSGEQVLLDGSIGHLAITGFTGVGGGGRGEKGMVENHNTLIFEHEGMIAENMILSYDGQDTVITFENLGDISITLRNVDFTDIDNLPSGNAYNFIFADQSSGSDSFDVFNDHSGRQKHIWNKDTVTFLNNADNTVRGRNSDDIINAMAGNDVIIGENGDDILRGQQGNDKLNGGRGDDVLDGGEGDDVLIGENGDDVLIDYSGQNTLDGGRGNDIYKISVNAQSQITDRSGNDELIIMDADIEDISFNEAGTEIFYQGNLFLRLIDPAQIETITFGNDTESVSFAEVREMAGTNGDDMISGNDGDNHISGQDGDDSLYGNDGTDTINGDFGNDIIDGGLGDDILIGSSGIDIINGGDGADRLVGGHHDDILSGDAGNDRLEGNRGNDTLYGGDGYDELFGHAENDQLFGNAGDDRLWGGAGDDVLDGGAGLDILYGGDGSDIFTISEYDGIADQVRDFNLTGPDQDSLDISEILSGFNNGIDDISEFVQVRYWHANRTDIKVNPDGQGDSFQSDFSPVVSLYGSDFQGLSAQDLVDSGTLIV